MNDYLGSISNLDTEHTTSKKMINDKHDFLIVSAQSSPPLVTKTDIENLQSSNIEIDADYLKPQRVIVRRYRLKK